MVKIFVEGKDKIFIDSYIHNLIAKAIISKEINFEIGSLNGWTNLKNANNAFQENSDSGGKNIVILDADTLANGGGFNIRKEEIKQIKEENNLLFDLFLFPNNNGNGDFETLLEKVINQKHIGLLECFSNYEECISKYNLPNNPILYKLPIKKSKIYSYVDAFTKSKAENRKFKEGDYFFLNPEIWDLSSIELEPLKEFLVKFL